MSIFILISGVVLLTHKKPEPGAALKTTALPSAAPGAPRQRSKKGKKTSTRKAAGVAADVEASGGSGEREVLWAVGDASEEEGDDDDDVEIEDEDIDHHQHPLNANIMGPGGGSSTARVGHGEEGIGLMTPGLEHDPEELTTTRHPLPESSNPFKDANPFKDDHDDEEFGEWTKAGR